MTTFIGLARDFFAAAVGVAILFDVGWSDEQGAGILLVGSTGLALGTYLYQEHKKGGKSA